MNGFATPAWAQSRTDLSGKTVAVIGGSGGVGEGVVLALLSQGATVLATGRDEGRLDELASRLGSSALSTAVLDGLDPDLDEKVAALASQHGPFDGAVVSVASWGSQGRKAILTLTDDEWKNLIEDNLTAVFRLYRAFIGTVTQNGILLQLNGLSADIPFPGNGAVALSAAAGKSMTRTIAAELEGTGRRAYEVLLGVVRTRARQLAGVDDPRWIDGTEVGVHVGELVAATSPLTSTPLHYFVDKAAGPVTQPPQI